MLINQAHDKPLKWQQIEPITKGMGSALVKIWFHNPVNFAHQVDL